MRSGSTIDLKRSMLLWALGLSVLLSLLMLAPSASALRFGVTSAQDPLGATSLARMGQGDVGLLRVNLRWDQVERAPGVYDWRTYDQLMQRATDNGVPVLPVVIGSPSGVGADDASSPPTTDEGMDRYRRFLKAAADRYGHGGRYRPITHWQIWNEVSLKHFWNGDPDAREYARFLKTSRQSIESEDRRAKIVLAGLPELTGSGKDLDNYLRQLYRVDGVKKQFDAVAIHAYAADERGVAGALSRLHSLLRKLGDGNRDVWVTEFGWGTGGTAKDRRLGFVKGESGQARLLKKTADVIDDRSRAYNVKRAVWFDWQDSKPPAEKPPRFYWYSGLFRRDGTAKPSWTKFVRVTGGNAGSGGIEPSAAPGPTSPLTKTLLAPGSLDGVLPSKGG